MATNEPVEVVLSSTERHGSNDTERHGDYPRWVRSRGHVAPVEQVSAEWSEVLPGIETRAAAGQWSIGERGATDTTITIRVDPEACPAVIEVDRIWAYYSEFRNEFEGTRYAVRVRRKKRATGGRAIGRWLARQGRLRRDSAARAETPEERRSKAESAVR